MATNIENILSAAYTAVSAITPSIYPNRIFERWRLREVDLDTADLVGRLRSFIVKMGTVIEDETFSTRARQWFRGDLLIKIGYPSPNEAARDVDTDALGFEGMRDSDLVLIRKSVEFLAFASISDMKSPRYVRSEPSAGTSTTHVFSISWAEVLP
jgi:hypothetical protein